MKEVTNHLLGDLKMKVVFTQDKTTKNKVRYSILPQHTVEGIMGTIYVDKDTEIAKDSQIVLEIALDTANN
jgi:hypothetical protein